MFPTSRSRRVVAIALASTVAILAGCTDIVPRVTEYGPQAYEFFVDGCHNTRTVVDGETQTEELGTRSFCECVYNGIADKTRTGKANNAEFPVPFDDFMEYDKEVQNAKAGEMPDPPANFTRAVESCDRGAGPSPSDTESTESSTDEPT